ncbi:MAG: ANTAR domain-containing protein, partial [Actinomycetota bacterium]|nr:ANTAR domain-containing protein [Actinomycetota bacterium]
AHAALGLLAALEHDRNYNLQAALENSRQIGIAIGILMSSQRLTREQAVGFLINVSQRLNRKLRDVAGVIADAGGIPDDLTDHSS